MECDALAVGRVAAAVVDEDDFPGLRDNVERIPQASGKLPDGLLLVV